MRYRCTDATSTRKATFELVKESRDCSRRETSSGDDVMTRIKTLLADLRAAVERRTARDRAREFTVRQWSDAHRKFWSSR